MLLKLEYALIAYLLIKSNLIMQECFCLTCPLYKHVSEVFKWPKIISDRRHSYVEIVIGYNDIEWISRNIDVFAF